MRTHFLAPRLTGSRLCPLLPESLRCGFLDAVDTRHLGTLPLEGGHPGGLRVALRLWEEPLGIENKSNATGHTGERVDTARAARLRPEVRHPHSASQRRVFGALRAIDPVRRWIDLGRSQTFSNLRLKAAAGRGQGLRADALCSPVPPNTLLGRLAAGQGTWHSRGPSPPQASDSRCLARKGTTPTQGQALHETPRAPSGGRGQKADEPTAWGLLGG